MKTSTRVFVAAALAVGLCRSVWAIEVVNNDKYQMNIGGRMQMFGLGQIVPDPYRDHARLFLFQKNARLMINGRVLDNKYEFQTAYGAEDLNGSNTGLNLLDLNFDVPLNQQKDVWLKIGQFRVPYSRERISDEAYFNFADRSIQNLGFRQGHDIGLAVHAYKGNLAGTIGTFDAGGRDVPERYLGERLGWPETVVRFGYNDGVDQDVFHLRETDLNLQRTTKAAFLNALYMHDTLIGHSTVLNLRTTEKSLLLNPNWNPYLAQNTLQTNGVPATGLRRGDFWQLGGDAVYRKPLGAETSLQTEAELNWAGYQNKYGVLHMAGGRAEASVLRLPFELGLRYAVLIPDRNMVAPGPTTGSGIGAGTLQLGVGSSAIHEITPSATWYVHKDHNMKLVFDAPVLLNMPVVTENFVGSYVLNDQPDQLATAKRGTGNINRRAVFDARMVFQLAF